MLKGGRVVCSCWKGADCPERDIGKHPIYPGGCNGASKDRKRTELRWQQHPDANIGLAGGNGVVVVDVDGPEGQAYSESLGLPATRTTKTSRGHHYIYRVPPDGPQVGSAKPHPEVDIKGVGGYVLGPGSVHRTGVIYEWDESVTIAVLSPELVERLRVLAPVRGVVQHAGSELEDAPPLDEIQVHPNFTDMIRRGVPEGERSEAQAAVIRALSKAKPKLSVGQIATIIWDPAHGIGDKARNEKDLAWLIRDIERVMAMPERRGNLTLADLGFAPTHMPTLAAILRKGI